jgi:Family of unknown function (DUF5995)
VRAMTRAASIGELIEEMEATQARLDAAGDARRHWHGVYRRGTVAVRDEIERGGFADPEWLERWDLYFAGIYLDAMDAWDAGSAPSGPWQVAFEATRDPRLPPLRHVLLGLNAHVNFDLPQALIGVISDDEFADPAVMARKYADHKHVDDVLVFRTRPVVYPEIQRDLCPGLFGETVPATADVDIFAWRELAWQNGQALLAAPDRRAREAIARQIRDHARDKAREILRWR